jgi:hypothetical protein
MSFSGVKMPEIGEIVLGKAIGKKWNHAYKWHACEICNIPSWRRLYKNNTETKHFCVSCSNKQKAYGIYKKEGYNVVTIKPDGFFAPMRNARGGVLEHRLVMAKHLGRNLQPWEIVHHRNGVRDDNRIENLELVTDLGHKTLTLLEKKISDLQARVTLLEAENVLLRNELSQEVK